ncbi:MAG: hypothetical protein JRM99_07390 [Nitrososphaerota archaeon]|nr:hypothetical protein [Nitrososphaerota archaeon]
MDLEEKNKRVRVGSPTTLALHDLGLSTTEISRTMRDSHGKYLDPAMRATVEKMRKWQSRTRTVNSEERGLSNVLSKISELCEALNLPDNVAETAAQIYRTSAKMKVAKSKSILGMTAATVYLACRKCGVSRTLKEVARAAGMEKGSVARYFRLVLKEVEKEYVPPPSCGEVHLEAGEHGEDRHQGRAPGPVPLAQDQRLEDLQREGTGGAGRSLRLPLFRDGGGAPAPEGGGRVRRGHRGHRKK